MNRKEENIRPLKNLGQHFLTDQLFIDRIVDAVNKLNPKQLLEIGPGTGALTRHLIPEYPEMYVSEVDPRSVSHLVSSKLIKADHVLGDFLSLNLSRIKEHAHWTIAGNLPYYIGSQIVFRVLEQRNEIASCVFMLQKEVAERLCAEPGGKQRGMMSPLVQAYFECRYLFTVPATAFVPPPNVLSAVISFSKRDQPLIEVDYETFLKFVKVAFSQRRKTLKNSLQSIIPRSIEFPYADKRAEQLSVKELEELCLFWLSLTK